MNRRDFILLAAGLATGKVFAQRDLMPDGGLTVFENRKPASFKIDDVMPRKYDKFVGMMSLDYYIGEKGTEFFKDNMDEIMKRMKDFFSSVGVKSRIVKSSRKLSRYTSASSMGVEFLSSEDFESRLKAIHIPVDASRFAGFYGGAQRRAFCRSGKEYSNPMVAAKLAMHEVLHGFSLLHPDTFFGMEDDPGNVMTRKPVEEQSFDSSLPLGQRLNERQIAQLHSFLGRGNAYKAFLDANYDVNGFAIKIAKASGLELNTGSMNR